MPVSVKNYCLVFILLLTVNCLPGQADTLSVDEQVALQAQLKELSREVKAGDTVALRRLIGYLDDDRISTRRYYDGRRFFSVRDLAWDRLVGYTDIRAFTGNEPLDRSAAMAHFTDPKVPVVYEPLSGRFSDQPPGSVDVRYRLEAAGPGADPKRRLADYKAAIAQGVVEKDFFTPVQLIPKVGALGTPAAYAYLQECADGQHWGRGESPRDKQISAAIISGLAHFRTLEAARLILKLARWQEGWGSNGFVSSMAWITNVRLGDFRSDQDSLVTVYEHLLDSLPSLPQLRELGYQQAVDTSAADFPSRSDYLAYVLLHTKSKTWIARNVLLELEERRDPRILPLLASDRLRRPVFLSGGPKFNALSWQQRLTGLRVLVENKDGVLRTAGNNRASRLNLLHYWVRNAEQYAWSEEENRFVYRGDDVQPVDSLRYFTERLLGPDVTAIHAAERLIRFPEDSLRKHLAQYRFSLAIQANKRLPKPLLTKLPLLSELRDYCQLHDVPTQLPEEAAALFQRLDAAVDEGQREKLVALLGEQLNRRNATALEVHYVLNSRRHPRAAAAVLPLLKAWYAEQATAEVFTSEDIQLMALKISLFKEGRFNGVWKELEELMASLDPASLAAVLPVATNERVREQLAYQLLVAEVRGKAKIGLADYVDYTARGVRITPEEVSLPLTTEKLDTLFRYVGSGDQAVRQRIIALIDHYRDTLMAPYLLAAAADTAVLTRATQSYRTKAGRQTERYDITVGDYMIGQLEQLYGKVFPVDTQAPPEDFMIGSSVGPVYLRNKRLARARWRAFLAGRGGVGRELNTKRE